MGVERGNDAQDHAPQPKPGKPTEPNEKQEAANYEKRDDGGAIEVDDVNSANDEGAN